MRQRTTIHIAATYKHVAYSKFDFRYERNGPWPQLMPDRPLGDLPEVVKIPKFEQKQYFKDVTLVYYWRLFTSSIKGLFYALTHDRYQKISDNKFVRQLTEGVYSKFLVSWQDRLRDDKGIGAELAATVTPDMDPKDVFFCDFAMIDAIADDCLPGNYVAPNTVVFRRLGKYEFEPVSMRINALVLTPADGNAWELAKYFALQAAEYKIKFIGHITLHFPFDTVNALAKSTLPTEHVIYKLLEPHLLLSLPVNNAVLESPNSVVQDNPKKNPFYSPFASKSAYVRKMLHFATDGIDDHAAYPEYDFFKVRPLNARTDPKWRDTKWGDWQTREVPSRFGEVMSRYWKPYYDFVGGVVAYYHEQIKKLNAAHNDPAIATHRVSDEIKQFDLEKLAIWANQIAGYLDGFPSDADIIYGEPGNYGIHVEVLTEALTTILWTVSLAHAMDHVDDARIPQDEKPYRLRMPPPQSKTIKEFSRKDLVKSWDFFPSTLIRETFTTPITTLAMPGVKYSFKENSGLQRLADQFQSDLKNVEETIGNDPTLCRDGDPHKQWIDLHDVACSVQY